MKFQIVHTTRYEYSQPVTLCHNEAHLRPRQCPGQVCDTSVLTMEPAPIRQHERLDYFGNPCTVFSIQESHQTLVVTATSTVARSAIAAPSSLPESLPWEEVGERLQERIDDERLEARHLVLPSPFVPLSPPLAEFALESFPAGRPLLDGVRDLSARIHRDFVYDSGFTTIATPISEVFAERRGVCQDFAHLAIACLRSLGLPARYVSGYIETVPPPGATQAQRGADASHAWFSVFDPTSGWVDFDPTNDQIVGTHHVVTAWGRDYSDVAPLKGIIFGGGTHTVDVAVDMKRIEDEPPAAPPTA